jgi:hypothetical protein
MPQDITKEIMEEFDVKFPNTKLMNLDVPVINTLTFKESTHRELMKDFILSALSKQRAEFRRVINEMKCEVPTNKRISDPLSEENVNKAILYAGRFNYNKALDDLLLTIKE